ELERFDIIVATSEKADSLLRHRTAWLQKISLVVADEVHLIHDPERGPTLEVILTKFRRFNPDLQVIALSATVKNSKELASWLEAEHVSSEWRPTPLKEGVYLDGEVRFTDNSRRRIAEESDPVWSLAKDSIREGGQCLVFVNTRRSTEALAMKMAPLMREVMPEKVRLENEEDLLLDHGEQTSIGKKLRACVHKGVAFHNAGLTNEQRRMVEGAFKKGRIKVIVATPTLAAGINLPARRVVIREVYRFEGGAGNVPIPVLEIKQMCGRAGRPRYDRFGEAILVARSEEESTFLFDNYLLGETEDIFSKLGSESVLRSHVLALVATSTTTSREQLMDFLNSTFLAHQSSMLGVEEAVEEVLSFLRQEELLRPEGMAATFFGRRVSDLYIDPVSAVRMRDALHSYRPGMGEFGFLHAACATPDMLPLYLRRSDNDWLESKVVEKGADLLLPVPSDLGQYEFFLAEVKTASVLDDWLEEMEEDDLLTKYGIGPGDLRSKVELGEWLLYSMRELSNIFNKDAYSALTELMTRVRYGVRKELMDLVKLRGVGRARARSLFDHGIRTLDDVRAAEVGRLARVPKIGDSLAKSIKEQVGEDPRRKAAKEPQPAGPAEERATRDGPQRSLLDF
ncbi:MAG: helix-hairpin-helix domain-containing protein, partial [Methanomassiliicoccales archaeon]|nr:helix-hairpin-helix domain-containing protein [Methanomassiliicoccales archaeon]